MKQKLVSGDEYDVVCAKRHYKYLKRAGVSSKIKRGMRVRIRREGKAQATASWDD